MITHLSSHQVLEQDEEYKVKAESSRYELEVGAMDVLFLKVVIIQPRLQGKTAGRINKKSGENGASQYRLVRLVHKEWVS